MGELPVVDAFQSHPFNGHLHREINTDQFKIETGFNLPAFGTYWKSILCQTVILLCLISAKYRD